MSDILYPVGRMIAGSLYKMQPVMDNFGKQKIGKDGAPMAEFNFGLAIPKGSETHWSQTPWGQEILKVGASAYPKEHVTPSFAWKIIDGDSTVPNKKGNLPSNQEGYKGNWIIWFKQGWAPKLVNADGSQQLSEPDSIVPGYYIQVYGSCKSNAPSPSPGVYQNPIAVALAAYGERIVSIGVDTGSVGFGGGSLPVGASLVPLAGMSTPVAATLSPVPQTLGLAPPPNPAILMTAPPPPPPAAPYRQMTAKAGALTYEQMAGQGWTEVQMREHGYLV